MTDIAELKIAIDRANREMYEAFSAGELGVAEMRAAAIERLGREAQSTIIGIELERAEK